MSDKLAAWWLELSARGPWWNALTSGVGIIVLGITWPFRKLLGAKEKY